MELEDLNDYEQKMCMVMGINWEPRCRSLAMTTNKAHLATLTEWFKGAVIKVRQALTVKRAYLRIPQNIKQQSHYRYYEKEPVSHGLVSGVVGGPVNKNSGWKGDNVTVLSDAAQRCLPLGRQQG